MNRLNNFIQKTKYYVYVICILAQIYGCIQLNPVSLFAIGWCSALLFCALVSDDII